MTPQEFKAWFEGFTEAFDRIPTKAQWARVKERVAEIDGKPVTERVFVDRYWPSVVPYYREYRPYWPVYSSAGGASTLGVTNSSGCVSNNMASSNSAYQSAIGQTFNSSVAMLDLGRADAKALTS